MPMPSSPSPDSPHASSPAYSPSDDYSPGSSPPSSAATTPEMPSRPTVPTAHTAPQPLPSPKFATPRGFPLLPPSHPLRHNLCAQTAHDAQSPPHTPKGHPLADRARPHQPHQPHQPYFSFDRKPSSRGITNPYGTHNPSHSFSFGYLLRVPRKLRPVLLAGVCMFAFGLLVLSRAMAEASALERGLAGAGGRSGQGRALYERRPMEEAGVWVNEGKHRALVSVLAAQARLAEGRVQSHTKVEVEGLRFESTQDELAALVGFITSTTANALPPFLDPAAPLDPSVVLDFDPAHPNAPADLALLRSEVHTLHPLILFGKMRDPHHRELQRILAEHKITPAPLVVDVDQRRDHAVFVPLLERLLGTAELPQLLLQGRRVGGYPEVAAMKEAGTLRDALQEGGAVRVVLGGKKKKGVKERERVENERVLGPAPIVDAE